MGISRILYFSLGVALGAGGAASAAGNREARNAIAGLIAAGFNFKEKVLTHLDVFREDVEDYLAEAKYRWEKEKEEDALAQHKESQKASVKKSPARTAKKPTAKKAASKKAAAGKKAGKKKPKKAAARRAP